jgi:hypothetical protein
MERKKKKRKRIDTSMGKKSFKKKRKGKEFDGRDSALTGVFACSAGAE